MGAVAFLPFRIRLRRLLRDDQLALVARAAGLDGSYIAPFSMAMIEGPLRAFGPAPESIGPGLPVYLALQVYSGCTLRP